MTRPAPRLKDIAERTGVSINTVSVALRGRSHIPEATRARILEAARELNYVPNAVARSLVRRSTQTIGVVLTNIMNPILTRAAQAIEENLVAAGYGTLFSISRNDLEKEQRAIEHLLGRQVDGILLYPADHDRLEHLASLHASGFPLVLLARVPKPGFDVVALDDRHGAAMMMRHLVVLGHREIAFLDGSHGHSNREKLLGYREVLTAEDVAFRPDLIVAPGGNTAMHGYEAMPALMARAHRPTAVFASSDSLAVGALRWCRENGIRVPDDLSIAGFDDIETAAFLDVPLTTVSYPAGEVGAAAVRRVVELVGLDAAERAPQDRVIEPRLVVRKSSGTRTESTGATS